VEPTHPHYLHQVAEAVHCLDVQGQGDEDLLSVFKQGDALITKHSLTCDIASVAFHMMVNEKETLKFYPYKQCKSSYYQRLGMFKAIKLANHYEVDPLIVPLDFLLLLKQKMEKKKYEGLVVRMVQMIK